MPNFEFDPGFQNPGISDEDAQRGFEMTNPMMTDAYSRSMPSWIKRLQERLRQGGIAFRDAIAAGQPQQQMPQYQGEDPMSQRAQALNQSYNQVRQMGQVGQAIGGLFGGGR